MEKDLKQSIELIKKLSESQILISIGNKQLILNEFSIKRVKDFSIKIVALMDRLSEKTGLDLSEMQVDEMITKYGDIIFKELVTLFNWIFEYKNPDYEKVTKKWVEDNLSIRILTELVKEIAVQNRLDWLGPLFKGKILEQIQLNLRIQE